MDIFNSLSRKKEEFKPLFDEKINMFVCGPTVYDSSHIGHARTYVFFDVAVKFLRHAGYTVFYLQNVTDIDDKVIIRARELGQNPLFLSRHYAREYFQDMNELKISSVSKYAPATKYIPHIIVQIKRLVQKGYVYTISEDGLYFDIKKFSEYGKLSGRTAAEAEDAVSRIDDSIKKRNRGDFCVWKFEKPGEPSWASPWGIGRPGWHIEDTAISEHFFGPQYDIHGGGIDLKFPHHESEIAQQEAASGRKPFVKYWMHTGHLQVTGTKMSKSLKNFITIRDLLKKYSAESFRLLVLQNHYRSPLNFTNGSIRAAEEGIKRIAECIQRLRKITNHKSQIINKFRVPNSKYSNDLREKFCEAMNDDFDTPKVIAEIFRFITDTNKRIDAGELSKKDAREILVSLKRIDSVLGIIPIIKQKKIPEVIKKLSEERERCRKEKNWTNADAIRQEIEQKGYSVKDGPDGPLVQKK
ncbi:MAG: cysteine--tRNA ligase [Candidatus Sungbacteria bacterium RIFCSPLOWO2_01_FULL_47_10]|uniref:Cysteine--tRNA ligase n=1 Tax=Candidatus Sungbacteria bacterium RIFCSPLOWO2_01_FULL_47_10 TaxID=1802276 RepID=A0A1G2KYE4_9BACT|nr:MAG: cysteine--tRNA ligase [Candidatus Sungbacteria bacterium RIFCSPLOWO2_01_FULL_47_10]